MGGYQSPSGSAWPCWCLTVSSSNRSAISSEISSCSDGCGTTVSSFFLGSLGLGSSESLGFFAMSFPRALRVRTVPHEPAVAADQLAVHIQHGTAADVAELARRRQWRRAGRTCIAIQKIHKPILLQARTDFHRDG